MDDRDFKPKYVYRYSGPVYHYDKLICSYYEAETTAATLAKAKSNIAWRYRNDNGFNTRYQLSLPGKTVRMD